MVHPVDITVQPSPPAGKPPPPKVSPAWEQDIRRQIATYKRFTRWVERWIDLSLEHSKLRMQSAKQDRSG